jgi:4-amino-4-deoxy-L-arabinose transferase-like glycosyltransferase
MTSLSRNFPPILLAILGIATTLRLVSLYFASQLPFFTHYRLDAQIYHEAGLRIASGDIALGTQILHMSPLYSYTLGILYSLFGNSPWIVPLFQLGLGVGSVFFIWKSAILLWGQMRWAALASLLAASYGVVIFYESHLLAETMGAFLWAFMLWSLFAALKTTQPSKKASPSPQTTAETEDAPQTTAETEDASPISAETQPPLRPWFLLGLLWGLCVLLRPNALVLLPIFGLLLWLSLRQRAPRALVMLCLAGALVIAPVTLRNRLIGGEWILVTDSGGFNFYIGNGQGAHGAFRRPPGLEAAGHPAQQFALYRRLAEAASDRPLSAREVDRFWYEQTWREIRMDWGRWLRLLRDKLWLFWGAHEISNNQDYGFHRRLNPLLALPLLQSGWILPWALAGLLWLLLVALFPKLFFSPHAPQDTPPTADTREAEKMERLLVTALALSTAVMMCSLVAFFILARYRLVLYPSLILCAVAALRQLFLAFSRAPWRALAAFLAILSLYPLVYTTWLERSFADEYAKLGFAYHLQQRFHDAEKSYLRALQEEPYHPSANKNLARLFLDTQRPEEAHTLWQHLLASPHAPPTLKQQALRALTPPTTRPQINKPR